MAERAPWTACDDRLLLRMRDDEDRHWPYIAHVLKRSPGACSTRYSILTGQRTFARAHVEFQKKISISDEMIADRDARAAAIELRDQDITASFFGDPPPGFSELDKKRAGAST